MTGPVVLRGFLGWGNRKGGLEAYGPGGRWADPRNGQGSSGDLLGDVRYCHGDDALVSFEGEDAARRAVAWLQGEDDEPTCYELAQSDAYETAPGGGQALDRVLARLEAEVGPPDEALVAEARRAFTDSTWAGATHLQADPPADDTGTGTIAHLRSGEWEPAAPAPKRVGQ